MIPHGVEVFVGLEPIDLRWSFDRLAGVVLERIGRNPRSGALFVFFGRRRTAIKVFFADPTGLRVLYKRLDEGTYRLPEPLDPDGSVVVLTERELDDLLDGIDVEPPRRRHRRTKRVRFH
ncbi:IS66 family insertion sequence element accessory protein TnpB [Myxococcota bacterium]